MMFREEGRPPLDPTTALRAMIALRDNSPDPLAKRLYTLANPRYKSGAVLRYISTKEAFTLDILHHELKIHKTTLYSIIQELELWGVVHKGYSIDTNSPGVNPVMYVLTKADPSLVEEARRLHLGLRINSSMLEDTYLRQLVAPIVEKVLSSDRWRPGDAIPEHYFYKPFKSENGYYDEKVQRVIFESLVEKGYNILRG